MITTRRSANNGSGSFVQNSGSNVALLEREDVKSYNEFVSPKTEDESLVQARERMQKNLEKLLNYDRYAEITKEEELEKASLVEEVSAPVVSVANEDDIRPSSTTMQFGNEDREQIYNDMRRGERAKESYRLNSKGKLIVVLYSLAVAMILALIMINTGVLTGLKNKTAALNDEINALNSQYTATYDEIQDISRDDYVLEKAEQIVSGAQN